MQSLSSNTILHYARNRISAITQRITTLRSLHLQKCFTPFTLCGISEYCTQLNYNYLAPCEECEAYITIFPELAKHNLKILHKIACF